jgi:putative nucleotidyltransferase with HDIG domain
MAVRTDFLRTRVARRILSLFIIGAMVPVVVMAVLSFSAVRSQLQSATEDLLKKLASNAAQSVAQQLYVTEGALHQLARLLALGEAGAESFAAAVPPSVDALALVGREGRPRSLIGHLDTVPALNTARRDRLAQGQMLVVQQPSGGGLLAAVAVDASDVDAAVLWARLVPDSIWGPADVFTSLPTRSDFCVLGADDQPMFCASGTFDLTDAFRATHTEGGHAGVVQAEVDGSELLVGYSRVLLEGAAWTVLVSESATTAQHPMSTFSHSFEWALLLGIVVVLLLTHVLIRKTMEPLSALEEGTRRIASGDLDARVVVPGRDELAALGASFNRMAGRLGLMFRQIETGRAIDDAVLTSRSADEAVRAILSRFDPLVPSCRVFVLLVENGDETSGRVWTRTADGRDASAAVSLSAEESAWLREQPEHRIVVEPTRLLEAALPADGAEPPRVRVLFPFIARDQVLGALWYEPAGDGPPSSEEVARARRIADQATVALDELRLVAELEELNWGTLSALARAIDAKSRWTSGHSERVTDLAIQIGKELGLDAARLEALRRGGLLHDIGKIGVPASILDQPGELSEEQRATMRGHPSIGARILEPIRAFRPALGVVAQHHERWDGGGYPEGLAGEEIDLLARVLAVADAYDAMVSTRPYRDSLDPRDAILYIENNRGSHFDPRVVDAFLRLMARSGAEVPTYG